MTAYLTQSFSKFQTAHVTNRSKREGGHAHMELNQYFGFISGISKWFLKDDGL
jgi:hypothetical protein